MLADIGRQEANTMLTTHLGDQRVVDISPEIELGSSSQHT